jgi:hypothetical protein
MEITGEEAVPLAGNHMEICTFSGVGDERFEEVWKAIKRVVESKPARTYLKWRVKIADFVFRKY